jgi:hypothetical protein
LVRDGARIAVAVDLRRRLVSRRRPRRCARSRPALLRRLNKLQIAAFLSGDHFGLPGWKAHAQLFRFDGQSLSQNLGDIQTADNLEAPPVTRLFEAWISRQWGRDNRSLTLRAGLIDLNSQFDSVDPASLMINSSHGIGPDLSRSGQNGPSIYPVSALGHQSAGTIGVARDAAKQTEAKSPAIRRDRGPVGSLDFSPRSVWRRPWRPRSSPRSGGRAARTS